MIKKIYLAQLSHCDPGYTALAAEVLEKHIRHLRSLPELCAGNPRYKWTCEEAWTVKVFLDRATAEERAAFFELVRAGRVEVGGFWGTLMFELPCEEELVRSCEYSTRLAAKEGFKVHCGIINDVPGIHSGIAEVLAGYGIRYLLWGPNTFRALAGWTDLPALFYLQAPSGARVLVWHNGQDRRIAPKDFCGFGSEYGFGDMYVISPYREAAGQADKDNASFAERGIARAKGRKALDELLERMAYDKYPYDAILLQCAADNRGPNPDILATIDGLNRDYSDLTFQLATPGEFFSYMEEKYQARIPAYSGVFIDSWTDGAGAMAKTVAEYRECQRQIGEVEFSLARASGWSGHEVKSIAEVYENLLWFSEHTFGHSGWNWRDRPKDVLLRSWADKAGYVDKARQFLDELSHVDSRPKITVSGPVTGTSDILENQFYRVRVSAQGQIQSIFDKELNRELIDAGHRYPFNGLVFSSLHGINENIPAQGSGKYDPVEMKTFTASVNAWRIEKLADRVELRRELELAGPTIAVRGRDTVSLPAGRKQIDIVNVVEKEASPDKEAIYFSFPFNLQKKQFQTYLEFPFHIVKFPEDLASGSHSDFSAVQHFAAMADENLAITWLTHDAPLVEIGDLQTFKWAGHGYRPEHPAIFSYVMNNTWPTNFQLWQGGEFTFRYTLTSGKSFDPIQAYRFKQEVVYPEWSALKTDPENITLTGVQLKDKNVIHLRLLEIAGREGSGRLNWPGVKEAVLTDIGGRKREALGISTEGDILFSYTPHQLITIEAEK